MELSNLLEVLSWRDAVDIAAVTILAYNLLLLIRGTRAVQALLGILVLGAIAYLADTFELRTLSLVLNGVFIVLPIAIIVLFQNQIRRGLVNFGKNPLLGFATDQPVDPGFQEIVLAATTMARRRIGLLIVFERLEGLRDYIENGIELQARVSLDLLLTIFNPSTPLHDGAVIISQDRIAAAACFLPLTSNPELTTRFGTRHRAALGITEETDALALVVSEETGRISIAIRGRLSENLDSRELRNQLFRYLVTDVEDRAGL